jgi:hypothetical protein
VAGGWVRLHNEELHNLYASPNTRVIKSRKLRWEGHVTRMGDMRCEYKILVGKSERKRPLRRREFRWEGNIRTHLKKVGWEVVDWIDLAQDKDQRPALVNMVMDLRIP